MRLLASFVPCSGEVALSFSQVSIAMRSYVLPSAAMTGAETANVSAHECSAGRLGALAGRFPFFAAEAPLPSVLGHAR